MDDIENSNTTYVIIGPPNQTQNCFEKHEFDIKFCGILTFAIILILTAVGFSHSNYL